MFFFAFFQKQQYLFSMQLKKLFHLAKQMWNFCTLCRSIFQVSTFFTFETFSFFTKNIFQNLSLSNVLHTYIILKFWLHFRDQHTLITLSPYFHQKLKYHLPSYRKRGTWSVKMPNVDACFVNWLPNWSYLSLQKLSFKLHSSNSIF